MSSTYTSSNGIEKMATGDQVNAWGVTADRDFDLIDQALDGVTQIPITDSGATVVISPGSLSTGRGKVIVLTGTLSGNSSLFITPTNIQKWYWILNEANEGVFVNNGAGSSCFAAPTSVTPVYCDGAGNVSSLFDNASFPRIKIVSSINGGPTGFTPTTSSPGISFTPEQASINTMANMAFVAMKVKINYSVPTNFFLVSVPFAPMFQQALAISMVGGAGNIPPAVCWASGGSVVISAPLASLTAGVDYETSINGWLRMS